MRPHVVRQGDTVASIVAKSGGASHDAEAAWSHPQNKKLCDLRGDPAVLFPGDVIFLPESTRAWLRVSVGRTNSFRATVPKQQVKIVLAGDEPLAGEPYVVKGLGDDISGTSDGSGTITVDVPMNRPSFILELPNQGYSQRVMVGHLDPVTEDSGVAQRLSNLGYSPHLAPLAFGPDGHALGLLVFQLEMGMAPTGEIDTATAQAIKKAHGA